MKIFVYVSIFIELAEYGTLKRQKHLISHFKFSYEL